MGGLRQLLTTALIATACMCSLLPPAAASTRQPAPAAFSPGATGAPASAASARSSAARLRALTRRARRGGASGGDVAISSTRFGAAQVASVAATLRSLVHGPELSSLSVYLATPGEIGRACGATALACYLPEQRRMVVSGVDRPVAGVPRDFAIAHEYGHHLANSRPGAVGPAAGGTPRWATYERVCQLTRRDRVVPDAGPARYWDDPEEAFADAYARLNRPGTALDWQYSSLLRPTPAALARIHTDIVRPYAGPVTSAWSGSLRPRARVASRTIPTPLDGRASVSVQATPGAPLVATLRDAATDRVLARAATAPDGTARLAHAGCGHDALRVELRATTGTTTATAFEAAISRP